MSVLAPQRPVSGTPRRPLSAAPGAKPSMTPTRPTPRPSTARSASTPKSARPTSAYSLSTRSPSVHIGSATASSSTQGSLPNTGSPVTLFPLPTLSPYQLRVGALHTALRTAFAHATAEPPAHEQQIRALERATTALKSCAAGARDEATRLRQRLVDERDTLPPKETREVKRQRWREEHRCKVLEERLQEAVKLLGPGEAGRAAATEAGPSDQTEADVRAANMRTFVALSTDRVPFPPRYRRRKPAQPPVPKLAVHDDGRPPLSPTIVVSEDDVASLSTAVGSLLPPPFAPETEVRADKEQPVKLIPPKPPIPVPVAAKPLVPQMTGDIPRGSALIFQSSRPRSKKQILQSDAAEKQLKNVRVPTYAWELLDSFTAAPPGLTFSSALGSLERSASANTGSDHGFPRLPRSLRQVFTPKPIQPDATSPPLRPIAEDTEPKSKFSVDSDFTLLPRPSVALTDLPPEFGGRGDVQPSRVRGIGKKGTALVLGMTRTLGRGNGSSPLPSPTLAPDDDEGAAHGEEKENMVPHPPPSPSHNTVRKRFSLIFRRDSEETRPKTHAHLGVAGNEPGALLDVVGEGSPALGGDARSDAGRSDGGAGSSLGEPVESSKGSKVLGRLKRLSKVGRS